MGNKMPGIWFVTILALAFLPAILFPIFMSAEGHTEAMIDRFVIYGFPIYLVVSAILSWLCYYQRRTLSWILIVVMVLADISMWILLGGTL